MPNSEVIRVLYKVHQIMNIYQLNKYVTCIIMYKHNRGMLPNIFNDMFIKHTPSHNYNETTYSLQNTTLQKQNTLTYASPNLWNTVIMKNHIDDCTSKYIPKGNKTIHLENILTRNTEQLGYSGIIRCNSMYE